VRKAVGSIVFLVLVLSTGGCQTSLPEPESQSAQLYQQRCAGCHRLYAPGVLRAEMWDVMLTRMEVEFARRGMPPLQPEEKKTILDYLQKHSYPDRPDG
jgi:mono/diheme cytochrome c family protein